VLLYSGSTTTLPSVSSTVSFSPTSHPASSSYVSTLF
jgi:hypothetical protein